jgi:sec-independent protein translocase protein TatA
MPFGLQPLDILVIVVVALVIFGPKQLPKLGRWLGKTLTSLRRGARDLADGFTEETRAQDQESGATAPADTGTNDAASGASDQRPETTASPAPGSHCTACGAANPAGARFCNQCGTRLNV